MKANEIIDNNSLSRLIAGKISEQIIKGELRAGDKLVESLYADEFGTSRAPIREALYLLTIEGLVERVPRKGAVVKGFKEQEIRDLLEIRIMLESLAMKRIMEFGIDESYCRTMENLLPQMESVWNDHTKYAELNHTFHLLIIEMSRSEVIKNMYSRLGFPLLTVQRINFLGEGNIIKSISEHRTIVGHLKNRNAEEALRLLEDHNRAISGRIKNS